MQNQSQNSCVWGLGFLRDFNGIWEGFGEGLGGLVGNFSRLFCDFLGIFSDLVNKSKFWSIWEVFREGFGRVWGRFWDGLGRVWEPFGRCWALPGLLYAVFRDFFVFWIFLASLSRWATRAQRALRGSRAVVCCFSSERSERAKLSGASSGFPWPIVHALLCCCLVLFSACCCCFGCFCFCWSCCPLLEILVPCSCMLQQLSKMFALPVPC